MTEEELVEEAARAIAPVSGCGFGQHLSSRCLCREQARAVLAAVGPKIRADERERAAMIADHYLGPDSYCAAAIRAGKEDS